MTSHCPNKELCGSCGWSHIPYQKQLEQKLGDINGSFQLKKLNIVCKEILPSPKKNHYRNRMDFVIDFEGRVGLREKGKWWKVIDNHPCFISDKRIEALFNCVREWTKTAGLSFYDRKAFTGILRYAVIRATQFGETMITIVTSAPTTPEERNEISKQIKKLSTETNVTTLIWSINHTQSDVSFGDELIVLKGPGVIEEEIGTTRYRISPNAFFQTNSFASPLLLQTVEEFAGDLFQKNLLDLYCGTGFFAVALAGKAKKTTGVELVSEAITDAKINAELNQVSVDFIDGKTEDFDWKDLQPDVVILDPPRSGMHDKALKDLMEATQQTIIYVSCNYKNFAREMVELQTLYQVTALRAIDQFPHTPHVELVAKLERIKDSLKK
ncbi:MAG: 23S rRNA (Uracil-5-)-methyltransferase [Candidatus Uhrbacteria bacterium GW2011_GWE2_40_58]|nr:MAG: 23S rRNA (Uracil-5-)-methyltransferase [Candidatus Uhrbacteria bacterium GW2011_GWF2_40_263]KKR68109.1 MAG: 23S rRNA (Uracil-5-)-methyltransferase [Candidatus Uhrbacteria bacterium GW2011_GWE2_40_58]OGL91809.1 MAG: 23S rRNA (uracil-5-)-methyltransferase RumA [Candidatus Uhrbacteria bacterium RIFOXYA2_FULL_40_9]OGL97259.1 MAG: 23S rRNA (uracil-5-)-methyltransferase RumA [Candidatus Uhrbacteria bacterium RIFOXYB2_FULL_41_18]HBK34433.1 23S rRNA (uracil(1939)-C(5))-methyltransferase RlmD [C